MPKPNTRHMLAGAVSALALMASPAFAWTTASGTYDPLALYANDSSVLPFLSSDWTSSGGNLLDSHTSFTETQLSPANVSGLKPAWVFTAGGNIQVTPTVEGDALYVPDSAGDLYRIDTTTGKAVWTRKVSTYTGISGSHSRNSPAIGPQTVIIGDQSSSYLMAVDKTTGALVWKTLLDQNKAAFITGSPIIVGNRVYVGVASMEETLASQDPNYQLSFRGSVQALDLATGKVLWTYTTVPSGYTGGAVWSSNPAVDLQRNLLYVDTGNNYSVPASVTTCLQQAGGVEAQMACLSPDDHIDSVLSLDLTTGKLKWARRFIGFDTYTNSCLPNMTKGIPCPDPAGPDYDFGSAPNLFRTVINGQPHDLVGAGQKSGIYWAMDADTGNLVWGTQVGPGGVDGGIEWGTASDGKYVYVPVSNSNYANYALQPSGQIWNAGSWAALDAATGKIVWQIPVIGQSPPMQSSGSSSGSSSSSSSSSSGSGGSDDDISPYNGSYPTNQVHAANGFTSASAANGVMYSSSNSGIMAAIRASDGTVLWQYDSDGSVIFGPAIVRGTLYWGSGDTSGGQAGTTPTKTNNKLYAFSVPAAQ